MVPNTAQYSTALYCSMKLKSFVPRSAVQYSDKPVNVQLQVDVGLNFIEVRINRSQVKGIL